MMLIQEPIHAAIWHCLNHYDFTDATFLSERLFCEVGSDESLHLLATCYYRSGKISQAYSLLTSQGVRTAQNKFLLAKCCSDLNKLSEAESLLSVSSNPGENSSEEIVSEFGDSASFALQLLAKIFAATERGSQASNADKMALKLNPFLWKSFESLCQRGDDLDPVSIFSFGNVDNLAHSQGFNPILQYANSIAMAPQHQPQQQQQHQNHFSSHVNTGSLTSTPLQPHTVKPNVVESTPVQPQLMSIITPVQNPTESVVTGLDSCFTASPMTDSSRMISGIGALNMTTDTESSNIIVGRIDCAPPAAPILGRRKRFPPLNSNITGNASFLNLTGKPIVPPVLNLNRFLSLETSGNAQRHNRDNSFGVLPHGTLSWSNKGVSINQEPSAAAVRLDFSSLAILSPFSGATTPAQDGCLMSSTPAASSLFSSPMPISNQSNINALVNATNSDQKFSNKRGLTESNSMKLNNVFTPSSQNNLQFTTPLMSSVAGIGSGQAAQSSANLSIGVQNVRRSSRLFVSSQQSKSKENSKGITAAPTKATRLLRSPSRKSSKSSATATSNKILLTPSIDLAAEKNEKNKEKMKKDSSMLTPMPLSSIIGHFNDQTSQILNAQAIVVQRHCIDGLLCLMRQFGLAFVELSRFNCRKAIQLLEEVPLKHRKSCWVLGHIGKANFELGEYKEAKRLFEAVRNSDPYRMEFMEYYSTALWHLQEEVELSAVAQELTRLDKFSSQAWCAAGNCFSHQKEHENAIKFFNRAIQIDPNFAYAYTLLGHEYVMIEELEKALSCFRAAVRVDPRHYNAWYGIGLTYYKQERFQLAEYYYRKALNINPQSPILMCHVAVVQHALQKTERALTTLQSAIDAAPQNPLCKFEKASILFSNERYHEALQELNELKALAPKESPVYFLIGKVHNKLNNTHLALMHFSWAMDLDPKVANSQIKDALDPSLNRVSQEDPAGSISIDDPDPLVVEDIELRGLEHTDDDDAIMLEADEPQLQDANADVTPIGQMIRASTPPAPTTNRHLPPPQRNREPDESF